MTLGDLLTGNAETARRLQIWLSVGVDERDEVGSTIYNSLLHFAPDGSLAARHRATINAAKSISKFGGRMHGLSWTTIFAGSQ